MSKLNKQMSDDKAKSSEHTEEAFSNIRTVKAFASEDLETVGFWNKNETLFKTQ